jgi:hypothetical protein
MKRIFAAVFALSCIVGYTPAFARGGHGGSVGIGMGHAGIRGAGPRMGTPNMQSRIPAPLPAPAQAPAINGPLGPSGLPAMGGGM